MKNTGMLFANDASKDRAKAVVGNIHRMGITNTVISEYDGKHFPKVNIVLVSKMINLLTAYIGLYEPLKSFIVLLKILQY